MRVLILIEPAKPTVNPEPQPRSRKLSDARALHPKPASMAAINEDAVCATRACLPV